MRRLLFILFIASGMLMQAQTDSLNAARERFYADSVIWADTVGQIDGEYYPGFSLDTVVLMPDLFFYNMTDLYKYNVLRRKVIKVYPLAKTMGDDLEKLDERLQRMTPRQRRHYKRLVERYVREVFEPQLKNLTVTEGRVLTKLVYRQTGMSVYDFLKKYKSGLSAVWWQSLAKIYKIDLKMKYDPVHSKDDFWMEDILQRAFADDILERSESKVDFDYYALYDKWMDKMPDYMRNRRKLLSNRKLFQYLHKIDSLKKSRQRRSRISGNP